MCFVFFFFFVIKFVQQEEFWPVRSLAQQLFLCHLGVHVKSPVPLRSPHGPPGGKINSVNLVHLVPQPQGLRCYWLPVPLLAGDPYEMGCQLQRGEKKAHIIFWTCNTTLRTNSKRYSHKSHFPSLFQWTASRIKIKFSPRLMDRSLFQVY